MPDRPPLPPRPPGTAAEAAADPLPGRESDAESREIRLHIDDLLGQLLSRTSEVLTARDGLRKLLSANKSILGELSLPSVLTRVIEAAADLVGARYGALGVIGPDGRLEQFIHVGIPAGDVAAIGLLPKGRGLLGALIAHPEPIRLSDLGADPRSSGFPAHHPPMKSFLGVPIKLRDEVYGNLYLTESRAGEFTEDDTELVVSLAGTAAIAIENARLFAETRRRQDWLQASTEITRRLLTSSDHDALRDIAEQVKIMADADLVTVVLPSDEPGYLRTAVATGQNEHQLTGQTYPMEGTLSLAAILSGDPIRITSAQQADNLSVFVAGTVPVGPVIALPLTGSGRPRGALLAARLVGRPVFSLAELDMAATFAGHAAVALELADARQAQDRLNLLEERDRIARDLHDHVIQRLFAAGLTVQSVLSGPSTTAAERLSRVVDDIDDTIRQIRTSIFALQRSSDEQVSVRGRLLQTIDEVADMLQQAPQIRFAGPIDTIVRTELVGDLVAVLRESLTNVARHADAPSVDVDVAVVGPDLVVDVTDTGVGMGLSHRRSGLDNLRQRAERRGGRFLIEPAPERGTHLQWTVPLG